MKRLLVLCVLVAVSVQAAPGRVAGTVHDFTGTGSGEIRAADERDTCVFCHGSHNSGEGLSNRPETRQPARVRETETMGSRPERLSAGSRACLSCHDGTVAVGSTRSRQIRMLGADRLSPAGRSHLGTDLSGSHPLAVRPQPGRRLRGPPEGDEVKLDRSGLVQCTSCHDPHAEGVDPELGRFLVKTTRRSALCLTCHEAAAFDPAGASHSSSGVTVPPVPGTSPSSLSMTDAGCSACHLSHGAEPDSQLVVRPTPGDPDSACLRCHGTGVASAQIGADLARPYSHAAAGRHEPSEGPDSARHRLPERSPGAARHVACVDCHDPHAASDSPAQPPFAGGALAGAWGIDLSGSRVDAVRFEYELCFKCHGDSANKPQSRGPLPPETVRRARIDVNLRTIFGPSSPSSHPVAGPGRNPEVPSLIPPLDELSQITCSDCHGSDSGLSRGPHGSGQPHLLRREYRTSRPTPESPSAYALCYGCHDRGRLLSETSPFLLERGDGARVALHELHVSRQLTPCATCHSAHGIAPAAGDPVRNAHLIDFDVTVVGTDGAGRREFADLGSGHGSCNLSCHGAGVAY